MTTDRIDHTICTAFGCCEPSANDVFPFCEQHRDVLHDFAAWLDDALRIGGGGGRLVFKSDNRCSFDIARAEWARRTDRQGV